MIHHHTGRRIEVGPNRLAGADLSPAKSPKLLWARARLGASLLLASLSQEGVQAALAEEEQQRLTSVQLDSGTGTIVRTWGDGSVSVEMPYGQQQSFEAGDIIALGEAQNLAEPQSAPVEVTIREL